MTAGNIRIRRICRVGAVLLDAPKGVSVQAAGEILVIDMTDPPESYVFEMQIFDAVAPTPAVQPTEVAFPLERVYLPPFKPRDPYECSMLTTYSWTKASGAR